MSAHRHEPLARAVILACRQRHLMIATAESCTGGKVAVALTDIAGSSDVVERGYVTYSNRAKSEALGIPEGIIERHGAVSVETACAMAEAARDRSGADMAVSITGIAGPGGGTATKPIGLVHFACSGPGDHFAERTREFGDVGRSEVRELATEQALKMLLQAAKSAPAGSQAAVPTK
ncbi:CinA family protein [Tepidamorphus sp. 3E244]|uniref:CinA family protein n=1 Tax=Tepidamorphus sp. 3E244 TaxID=3385498 RepID=UPI0038FBF391